ncbi:hypothetical protein ACFOZ0_06675 [Streptomyces yaanensis]|uniref:Uncharacterized protein n=1 Tax=Streptomyces yaanensis TaxID=1142239 RepID=A0ABV7S7J3_9ACTN|nr:hypothetical protein [Streptomyces sp. CGMCC 4.7035]WNC02480.1 hypothetical protein Q2K21_32945 [Streptomyces sp. CGMCC 4.7035]
MGLGRRVGLLLWRRPAGQELEGLGGSGARFDVVDAQGVEMLPCLKPQDVARTIGFLASLPARVNLPHVTVMPTGRPY